MASDCLKPKKHVRKGWRDGIAPGTPEWEKRHPNWICRCSDTSVVPRGERCPHCGKTERERA